MKTTAEILGMIADARAALREAISAEHQAWNRYQTESKVLRQAVNIADAKLAGLISAATARGE